MKHFYAIYNPYGDSTGTGFRGKDEAFIFNSKAARNSYVRNTQPNNLSVDSIAAKEAYHINRQEQDRSRVFWSPEEQEHIKIVF